MDEKGPLEELLKAWQTPAPHAGFEMRVLKRLRSQPERISPWQRWFAEPLEYATATWRPQAAVVAVAALMLALFIGLNRAPSGGASADFGLDTVSTFPSGSFTQAYLEMVNR